MKYKELENLGEAELLEKQKKLKEQLYKLNYQRHTGRVEKPHLFYLLKKDVARIEAAKNQIKKERLKEQNNKKSDA